MNQIIRYLVSLTLIMSPFSAMAQTFETFSASDFAEKLANIGDSQERMRMILSLQPDQRQEVVGWLEVGLNDAAIGIRSAEQSLRDLPQKLKNNRKVSLRNKGLIAFAVAGGLTTYAMAGRAQSRMTSGESRQYVNPDAAKWDRIGRNWMLGFMMVLLSSAAGAMYNNTLELYVEDIPMIENRLRKLRSEIENEQAAIAVLKTL